MILIVVILTLIFQVFGADPVIDLPNGKIRGKVVKSRVNDEFSYYIYQGIPFAAPPIGNLRFQPPQPIKNWDGIKDVFSSEVTCYQVNREDKYQSEDCLYLSVYTPVAPLNDSSLNVLVFIYGGSFIHGHMFYEYTKFPFLMEENIVTVTFNYRIGPFGFLSTEDKVIPGNMGLKDQQFVLKWIQKNIHLFGGDPEKVTIMGQSAGAASATYQLLAPGSAGLFRAVIGCSGSALTSWAYERQAAERAYGIAAKLDPSFSRNRSSQELLEFLQSVDAVDIHNTGDKYNVFAPVIEVPHEGAIISDYMYDSADYGAFNKVPVLLGINSEEAIAKANDMESLINSLKQRDELPELLVNSDLYITDKETKNIVGNEIKKIYVNDSFHNHVGKGVQFLSDDGYTKAVIKFAELIAQHVDVYFYQFSYYGKLGGEQNHLIDGIGKVAHAEDQRYFWAYFNDYSDFPESDIITLRRYNKLFSNFIKYLNPTPEKDQLFENVIWPKVTPDHYYYLDIDTNLTIQENPREFSYKKWVDIFEKYVTKPFISY